MNTELNYLIQRIEKLENKKIESIDFTDGSSVLNLDLDNKTLSVVYDYADRYDTDFNQALVEMIEAGLELVKKERGLDT